MIFQEIDRVTTLDACVVTSTPHAPTLQTYSFPILAMCQSRWIRWMFCANTRFLKWLCQGSFVNRGGYDAWKNACGHVRDGLSLQQYETLARHSDLQIDTIVYNYKSFSARILWEIQWLIWPNSWKFLLWIPHTCIHLLERARHTRVGFNILIKWRKTPPDASSESTHYYLSNLPPSGAKRTWFSTPDAWCNDGRCWMCTPWITPIKRSFPMRFYSCGNIPPDFNFWFG
jgi:hypothetical protein